RHARGIFDRCGPSSVIPAKAEVLYNSRRLVNPASSVLVPGARNPWIPAFAGMTEQRWTRSIACAECAQGGQREAQPDHREHRETRHHATPRRLEPAEIAPQTAVLVPFHEHR